MSEPAHEKQKGRRHQTSIDEIFEDVSKFLNDPIKGLMSLLPKAWGNQRELRILVTGKTGQGKSALINGILGDKEAQEGASATRCTTTVTEFEKNIHGVPIKVFDSPGLQDRTQNEEEYIQGMRDKCRELSLVLYCTKMINHRLTDDDRNAMRKLTKAFGDKFWNYAVLVLTFANMEDCGKKDDRDEDSEEEPDYDDEGKWRLLKKKRFECRLEKWEKELKEFLIQEVGVSKKIAQRIPVVPTGDHVKSYNNRQPMRLPDRDDWFDKFWCACCLRVKDQKLFLEVNQDRIIVADDIDNSKIPKSEETENAVATKELEQQQQQQQKQQQLKLEEGKEIKSKSNKKNIENETLVTKLEEGETKHDETSNEEKKESKGLERKLSDKVKSWQKFEKEQQQQQECPPENPRNKAKNTDFQKVQQKKSKNPPPIPSKPVPRRKRGMPTSESLEPQEGSHTSIIENSTSDSLKMIQPSASDEASLSVEGRVEGLSFQDTSTEPTSSDQITSTLDLTKPNSTATAKTIEEEPSAMIDSQTIQPTPGDQVTFQSSPSKTIKQDSSVTVLQEEPNILPSVINMKDLPSESKSLQNSELTPSDQMSLSPPKLTKPNSTVPIDIVQEDPSIVAQDEACQAIQSIPSDQVISSSFLPTSDLNVPMQEETSISSQDTSQEPKPPSDDQITVSPTTNSSDLNSSSSSLPTLMNCKSKSFDQDNLADHKITMDKELVENLVEETMRRKYGDAGANLAKKALRLMAKPVKWFVGLFKK